MRDDNKKLHKTNGIAKRLALGVIAGGLAFSAPVAPAVMSGAGTVFAAAADTIGTKTVPKYIRLNAFVSNRTNSSKTYPTDWYYFETDGNKTSDEYIIDITLAKDIYSTYVNLYKWIQRENRTENVAGFNVYSSDGHTQKRYYLDTNSKYIVSIEGRNNYLNYVKFGVIHKQDVTPQEALVKNLNGRWVYHNKNGKPDYSFTGVAKNTKGKWMFVRNGVFDPTFTGVARSTSGKWIFVKKGRFYAKYTGAAKSISGNYVYVINGRFSKQAKQTTGVAKSTKGKYIYIRNGRYYPSFTGLARNVKTHKLVYVKKGKYDNTFTGKATYKGKVYNVVKGRVVK